MKTRLLVRLTDPLLNSLSFPVYFNHARCTIAVISFHELLDRLIRRTNATLLIPPGEAMGEHAGRALRALSRWAIWMLAILPVGGPSVAAQERSAAAAVQAQNPNGSKRQSSGDDAMNGLDAALRNAGIDGETGRNVKTLLKHSSNPKGYADAFIASLNNLVKATDSQSSQRALQYVGDVLGTVATSADYHIIASGNDPNLRTEFAKAATALLAKAGADKIFNQPRFVERFEQELTAEKTAGMDFRHWGFVFAKSIENSRAAGGFALVLTFETGPNPLYYSYTGARSGAEWVTDKIDLIEANSNPGNAPDHRHLTVFFTSFNFEIRKARNQVPATLSNPFPSAYDLLAQDIADEALKFSGPNLGKLTDIVAGLLSHATVKENGPARNITREEVTGNLEQLRGGSPQGATQAKATLRAWLLESVDYQLRHPQAAAR